MMKKNTFLLTLGVATIFLATGCVQQPEKVYPYTFNTAHIEFEITGDAQGTSSLFIKGDRSVNEFHGTKTDGTKVDALFINAGEKLYQIDLNTRAGTISKNPIYEELKKVPASERMNYLVQLAVGAPRQEGEGAKVMPTPKSEKEIAGQKCQLFDVQNVGEVCIWGGVSIYSNVKIPDAGINNTSTAVKIETNMDVPDSTFNIPEGVKLQDTTQQ